MNTWRWTLLLAVGLLLFTPLPSQAERHGFHGDGGRQFHGGHSHFHSGGGGARFFVGVGPVWPVPWWYYPAPAYVYSPPPVVVVQPPPVYVAPPQRYWYFCQSFNAYYPEVPSCPEPWMMVPARPF
jgi:hypothetical protein